MRVKYLELREMLQYNNWTIEQTEWLPEEEVAIEQQLSSGNSGGSIEHTSVIPPKGSENYAINPLTRSLIG